MIHPLLLLLLAGFSHPSANESMVKSPEYAAAASVCPSDRVEVRERVARVISSPSTHRIRMRDGWSSVNAGNLRVLTDATDAAMCDWLRQAVPMSTSGRAAIYYYADGFYFVGTYRAEYQPPNTLKLGGWQPIIVFRADRTLVGSYAS